MVHKLYEFGDNCPVHPTQAVKIKISSDDVEEEIEALVVPGHMSVKETVKQK